jgi:phage tail-like protein
MESMAHPAFRYAIKLGSKNVGAFTECTLPTMELEVQEIKEGGVNAYTHAVPGRRKKATLSLKNGIGTGDLFDWCVKTLDAQFTRETITITMMGVDHKPLLRWHLEEAYPIKWTFPQFKADTNTIAIQTIEFACHAVTVEAA